MLCAMLFWDLAQLRPDLAPVDAYIRRREILKDMYAADWSQPPDTMCTLVDPEILSRMRDMTIIAGVGH